MPTEDRPDDITSYPLAELDEPEEREDVEGNTDEENEGLDTIWRWWELDRDAKASIQDEFEEAYLLYKGDHWDLESPTGEVLRDDDQKQGRPNIVENASFTLINGVKAEFSNELEFIDRPGADQNDDAAAKKMTELKAAILQKNRFPQVYRKWLHWFVWLGTGCSQARWDPDWITGQGPNVAMGDVRVEAIHPQCLYPDGRCGDDIQIGYRIHKAVYRPLEYIREHYPERGHLVREDAVWTESILGVDTETDVEGEVASGQEGMALLIETWYRGKPLFLGKKEKEKGTGLHVVWWAGETNRIYLGHENYRYYKPNRTVRFPFVLCPCHPREDSPWGYGLAYLLKPMQIALNRESELALEGLALQAVGTTIAKEGSVNERQAKQLEANGTIPGIWLFVDEPENIDYRTGQGIPASLLADIERRVRTMEGMTGRQDITQGKSPSGVEAFRALSLLAERSLVLLKPQQEAITSAWTEASEFISLLVTLNYNERRSYRLLGEDDKVIRGFFAPDDIQRVWDKRTGDVFERSKFLPSEDMEEGKDYEYFSAEFDSVCEVGKAVPMDRIMAMEMAKELLGAKLITPEIAFDVFANGRFPPWETVKEQMQALFQGAQPGQPEVAGPPGMPQPGMAPQAIAAPQPVAAPQVAPPGGPPGQIPPELLAALTPEQRQQLAVLPPEEQAAVLQEMMAVMQMAGGGPVGPPR